MYGIPVSARVALVLAVCCGATWGQLVTGSISGTVADQGGSAIAGAALKLVSTTTGAVREVRTDDSGDFAINAVQPGTYNLAASHPGFKTYEAKDIEVRPNENIVLGAIKLPIGEVSESITVAADAAVVQTATGERSGVITSEEVENLTVMNRDFSTLITLMPGVVGDPGEFEVQGFSAQATFNVNGGRTNGNSITIDGASVENSNGGNPNNFVSMDSVQTVRIMTSNFQAEFGRKPGASIMAVSKGGAQHYHGTAYWYYRHEWMNANNFFNNRQGVPQTPRRVTQPGANFGGPIYIPGKFNRNRDKLFFFTNVELIRERRPQAIQQLTMPSALERQGDFSQSFNTNGKLMVVNDPLNGKKPFPGNIVPAGRINKSGQNYLNLLPLPNYDNTLISGYRYNYQVQESLNIPKVLQTTRVDYRMDDKTSLWLKYNYWREDQQGWAVSAGNAKWGWIPNHYINATNAVVLALTRIIGPATILEGSATMTRWTENGSALNPADMQRLNRKNAGVNMPQFHPENNPLGIVPQASFSGVSNSPTTTLNARFPLRGAETPFTYTATLTNTRGKHVSKLGLYIERWRAVKGESGTWAGNIAFDTDTNNPNDSNHPFANALLGNFKTYSESNTRPPLYEFTTSVEWFVQDNWKITRKLTLDVGLRFGWSQPWHSNRRQEAGFVMDRWDPAQAPMLMQPVRVNNVRQALNPLTGDLYPATIIGAIVPGYGNAYDGTVNLMTDSHYPAGLRQDSGLKMAPRFGFAYDPWGNGKTAIRGGFGIFYEIHEKDLWSYALHLDPPNQLTPQIYYGNLDTFIQSTGFLFPSNTAGMDMGRALARTMNYSFGVQRQIGRNTMIDASYVAALSRHLTQRSNLNSIPLGTTLNPANYDPSNGNNPLPTNYLRPYMGYGDILMYSYDGNSSYHSLQTMFNQRFSRRVSGDVAYTWSKAMDYVDADNANVSNLVDRRVWNYGLAGFDRTHILKAHWIWEMPRASQLLPDWRGITTAKKAVLDGWQVSGITTFLSGAPTAVSLSLNSGNANNWSGSPTDAARPDVIANPILPKSDRTFSKNFNTAAFALPAQGTWGNAPKYPIRGPGINNWDISIFKNFRVSERFRAQLRCESYNTFNHTQFSSMDTSAKFDNKTGALTNLRFGEYTAARLARRMQLALRINF